MLLTGNERKLWLCALALVVWAVAGVAGTAHAQADLRVTKSDDVDPVLQGDPLTYTVVVTNNGPDPASNVVLTDTMPAGVSFNFATITQGTCSIGFPLLQCQLGTMNAGATVTLTINVTPNAAGGISNAVSVTADTTDPDGGNNNATEGTTVTTPTSSTPTRTPTSTPTSTPTLTPTPAHEDRGGGGCSDGIDNDGDGLSDCADPDCLYAAPCPVAAPVMSLRGVVVLIATLSLVGLFGAWRIRRRAGAGVVQEYSD